MRLPLVTILGVGFGLGAGGCAGSPGSGPGTDLPPLPRAEVRATLPAGTTVELLDCEVREGGSRRFPDTACNGLLREALTQSSHLDLAAGVTATTAPTKIRIVVDSEARTLSATLVRRTDAPVPLTASQWQGGDLPAAVDDLAIKIRQSLGEEVTEYPIPSERAYSGSPKAVTLGEQGWDRLLRGNYEGAQAAFESARRMDGGSPPVLQGLAAVAMTMGRSREAETLAGEALEYEYRLHPTATHRLTRTLLQARAAANPGGARERDAELLEFGLVGARERPHDVEPQLSQAIALNYLSHFEESATLLRDLTERLPGNFLPAYHLVYAELALGQPAAALAALESIGRRLPSSTTALPRALALYHEGLHDELMDHLARLARNADVRNSPALHDVRRMQASHAILTGRQGDAVRHLLEDLDWMRSYPSRIGKLSVDLAEAGEVLVRLGAHRELGDALRAFDELGNLPPAVIDALVFVNGLVEVALTGNRAELAEERLARRRGEHEVWGNIVKALGHRQRGELADEAAALARAADFSEAPLIKAALANTLRGMGRTNQAKVLIETLRRELFEVDLRTPSRHPLLNPATALAYLLE